MVAIFSHIVPYYYVSTSALKDNMILLHYRNLAYTYGSYVYYYRYHIQENLGRGKIGEFGES